MRTFIAAELPEEVRESIRRLQGRLKTYRFSVRWVRAENVHLTFKFLGDTSPEALKKASSAMEAACSTAGPFTLQASGIGAFPGVRNPRVLWAGVGGEVTALRALQAALDRALAAQGFARESRPFTGHLTLGRVKGAIDGRSLADAMAELRDFSSAAFTVRGLTLFKSDLRREGAVYTRLTTTPLPGEATK